MQPGQEGPKATQGEKPGQGPQTPGLAQVCDCPRRLRFTLKNPRTRLWFKPQCREPCHRDEPSPTTPPRAGRQPRWPGPEEQPAHHGARTSMCSLLAPQPQPGAQTQGVRAPGAHPCCPCGRNAQPCPPPPAPHLDSSQRPLPHLPPGTRPSLQPRGLTSPTLPLEGQPPAGMALLPPPGVPTHRSPPQLHAHIIHQDGREPGLFMLPSAPAHRPPDSPSHHVRWAGNLLTFSQASALTPV